MPFTPKSWGNFSTGGTPLTGASLIDLETRLAAYADTTSGGPFIDMASRGVRMEWDPTFDNAPLIQAAIDEIVLSPEEGGTILLPEGNGYIGSQIVIAGNVTLRGMGKRATELVAMNQANQPTSPVTFPSNSALVRLGRPTGGDEFDMRVESLGLNCNGITGMSGVYSRNANEGSAVAHVGVWGFNKYGVWWDRVSKGDTDEIEAFSDGSIGAGISAIFFDQCALEMNIRGGTFQPGTFGHATHGVHINSCQARVTDIHCEQGTNGIFFEYGTGEANNISGNSATVNLIRMNNGTGFVTCSNINRNGSTHTIVDDFFSTTYDDTFVTYYNQQGIRIARTYVTPGANQMPSGTGEAGEVKFNSNGYGTSGFICQGGTTWHAMSQIPSVSALSYSSSITPNGSFSPHFTLSVNNTTPFTMNAPLFGFGTGQVMTIDILNAIGGGGVMGAITWVAAYKLAGAFVNPADTKRRTISFYYDGTNWVETSRAMADI